MSPTKDLSLEQLQLKTILLICMATMWRPRSDVGRLQYRDMISSVRIHARTPKEGQVKSITLGKFDDEDLCPVQTIYTFITRIAMLRQELPKDHNLFLTYIDSTTKVSTSVRPTTVANWAKAAMDEAGIDTKAYQAHSIRAASSTKAAELGHSIEQVKKHANWSLNSNTFEKFYYKPSLQPLAIHFFLVRKSVSHWSQLGLV